MDLFVIAQPSDRQSAGSEDGRSVARTWSNGGIGGQVDRLELQALVQEKPTAYTA